MTDVVNRGEATHIDATESEVVAHSLLVDLEEPSVTAATRPRIAQESLTARQQLHFYESGEWEEFVLEWACALRADYDKVKRFAGAGDRGMDVVGLRTPHGLEAEWDCYQCKHYNRTLGPADAYPEILKIMLGVLDGEYTFPRRYRFVAPRGSGMKLNRLLSSPSKLKQDFIATVFADDGVASSLNSSRREAVLEFAKSADYSVFDSEQIHELLDTHQTTRYFHQRFGVELPPRPEDSPPPDEPTRDEWRYIEKLLAVYREVYPEVRVPAQAMARQQIRRDFQRHRESFYAAESLRVFARDSLPDTHYIKLQKNIFDAVIEICEAPHSSGRERLRQVLVAAVGAPLTSGLLISATEPNDKKGICHQLANDDRLDWTEAPRQ